MRRGSHKERRCPPPTLNKCKVAQSGGRDVPQSLSCSVLIEKSARIAKNCTMENALRTRRFRHFESDFRLVAAYFGKRRTQVCLFRKRTVWKAASDRVAFMAMTGDLTARTIHELWSLSSCSLKEVAQTATSRHLANQPPSLSPGTTTLIPTRSYPQWSTFMTPAFPIGDHRVGAIMGAKSVCLNQASSLKQSSRAPTGN